MNNSTQLSSRQSAQADGDSTQSSPAPSTKELINRLEVLLAGSGHHVQDFVGFMGMRRPKEVGGLRVYIVDHPMMVPLDPRNDLYDHSPGGFQWGYGGSGPAQLALAICANVVGDERALRVYQDFKWQIVAHFRDSWELGRADALRIIEHLEHRLRDARLTEDVV